MSTHSTNGERQLDITDKVTTLYGLIIVEMAGAKAMASTDDGLDDISYLLGRIGGYDFMLSAMEMRWPELKGFRPTYEVIQP